MLWPNVYYLQTELSVLFVVMQKLVTMKKKTKTWSFNIHSEKILNIH